MLGRLPWFALERRSFAFFFFVFFDMADEAIRQALAGPLEQLVGGPRVDDPVERHGALGGPVAAVRLPLQLAGGVGIGVDREAAAVVDGQLEQRRGGSRRSGRQLISTAVWNWAHAANT